MNIKHSILAGGTILIGSTAWLGAGEPALAPAPAPAEPSTFCDMWDLFELYKNPDNGFIQSLAFTGRLQADWAVFDEDDLGDYNRLSWRRARAGFKAKIFNDFTLHAEADFDLRTSDVDYRGITDAYVAWSPDKALKIMAGKQSVGFTLDGATSSKRLITTERSNIANNIWFPREYFTGLSVGGSSGGWKYKAGIYAGDRDPEFGLDQGQFYLVSLGRDLSDSVGLDEAAIRLDYVYNDADMDDFGGTRSLKQLVSLSSKWENGDWGLWTDLSWADGFESRDQSDLFGLQLMPFYNFTDKLQGVFRYTYLQSDDDNGVRLNRYENRIERGRGDTANEFYLGLNYYICDHRLKLQTGVQYANMNDDANDGGEYDGWGWTTGLRFYW